MRSSKFTGKMEKIKAKWTQMSRKNVLKVKDPKLSRVLIVRNNVTLPCKVHARCYNTFSSPLSALLSSLVHSYSLVYLCFLLVGCQAICFKNSSYIFSKTGRYWDDHKRVCTYQKGYLVSIETEEEWQFINQEIQKRSTWNTSAWHIGLENKSGVWTWLSGKQ